MPLKFVAGGRANFVLSLKLLAERGDQNAQKVYDRYRGFTGVWQNRVTFEQLLIGTPDIDVLGFIKELAGVSYELGVGLGNVFASAYHPTVVARSVDQAMTPSGIADRKMQFQHHRFVPTAKGAAINIGIVNQQQNTPAASEGAPTGRLPSFEEESLAMRGLVRRQIKGAVE